jgi:hypothetical protein
MSERVSESVTELFRLLSRRAGLLREVADLDLELARVLDAREAVADVEGLSLEEAARYLGEPKETVRRRPEYLKARISAEGARRLRYSRRELERILADRLAGNALGG